MHQFESYTSRGPRRRRRLLFAVPVVLLVACVGGFAGFALGSPFGPSGKTQAHRAAGAPLDLTSRKVPSGAPVNVLVLGVDKRPHGESKALGGVRSDTIMLARVFPESGEVHLLSIPRDLYVEVSPGREDRINAAYADGGLDGSLAVVNHYTGIPIDHYAVVDFAGFTKAVDALGGVELDVRGSYPLGWHLQPGQQRLNGRQALFYARYRDTPGGDLDRIRRQQQMVSALEQEVLDWKSLTRLPQVAKAVGSHVQTDVGVGETLALARDLEARRSGGIKTYELKGTPKTLPDGREVLIPDDAANRAVIAGFLR